MNIDIDFVSLQKNDRLHIPGDTGGLWRINKFIEFHHKVKAVDPLMLLEYAKRNNMNNDEIVILFWMLASTYSEITAIFLFNDIKQKIGWDKITKDIIDEYWVQNKSNLQFGSARRYAKSMDWFPILVHDFLEIVKGEPYGWIKKSISNMNSIEGYQFLYKELLKMKFMGRFSIELFLMNFKFFYQERLLDINIEENVTFNWKKYSNETSGLLNLFYYDEKADEFDKTGQLSEDTIHFLDNSVNILKDIIQERYGTIEAEYLVFMPRICTFRNFCKKNRYAGFHHDRQLGFIKSYEVSYPNYSIWKEIYDIRKSIYPNELLGELHGWIGIRPERKKMFLEKGLTGAEIVK